MLFFELLTSQRGVSGDAIETVLFQILNVPLDPAPMMQTLGRRTIVLPGLYNRLDILAIYSILGLETMPQ